MKLYFTIVCTMVSLTANAQEYKRLHRTYLDFSQMNLEACEKSFRSINNNYMDCEMDLPEGEEGVPLVKISPGHYMPTNVSITSNVGDYQAYVDMRDTAFDYDDGSLFTHLVFSMYYQLPDQPGRLQSLAPENYSWPVFEKFLRQALSKISQDRKWKTSSPIIALPWSNSAVQEHIIGSVYVAVNKLRVDVSDCQRNLTTQLIDAWPAEDYWITKCSLRSTPIGHGESLPLTVKQWANSLLPAEAKPVLNKGMSFHYSAWGWEMQVTGKYEWSDIADQAQETLAMVGGNVEGYYIVDEANLYQYGGPGWTLGKLIQKNGKMDIEPNPQK